MNVQVTIPDEIFNQTNEETSRRILEAVALEGYKSKQLTAAQIRRILGFESSSRFTIFWRKTGLPGLIIRRKTPNAKEIFCANLCLK